MARRPFAATAASAALPGVLAGVLAGALLAACGTPGSSDGPATAAGATASTTSTNPAPLLVTGRGGTATVALGAIPMTLNDHTVAGDTEAARIVASTVWVQVFQIGPSLKPQLDTDVVQSAEVVSVNPQTVVYQIAPKAVWSDGVPITASDFQYAWQAQRGGATDVDGAPDSVASTLGYRDIASVLSSNAGRTVTVTFRKPDADWESLFDDLLPAHIAEQVGWNHGFDHFDAHVLVSAGPWLIEKWVPGRQVVLVRNPRWWGTVPRMNRITLEAVTDPSTLARDVSTNRVQVAAPDSFDAALMAELSALPKAESESPLGATMLQLEFNVTHAPLNSVAVRQGIAHAIDRVGIVTGVAQPLNPSVWLDNNHLFANSQPTYNDNATGYETVDLAAAHALLTQGGLVADAAGTWTSHGTPVTLDLTWSSDDPWSAAIGPLVASQLVGAGFTVDTVPVSGSQLTTTVLPTGSFELALVPVQASAYPSQLGGVFSPTVTAGSPALAQDWTGFDDPAVDALFTQAQGDLSANQATAMYQQIDQDLWQDMPTFPLLAEPDFMAFSASVLGVQPDPGGLGVLWQMDQWAPLVAAPPMPSVTTTTKGALRTAR
ncbi:MAG TPA: ABC transporter family substrate-binding protein [Acidimicrobiales bacterium]